MFALAEHNIVPNETSANPIGSTADPDPKTYPHAAVDVTNALRRNLLSPYATLRSSRTLLGVVHVDANARAVVTASVVVAVDTARRASAPACVVTDVVPPIRIDTAPVTARALVDAAAHEDDRANASMTTRDITARADASRSV